MKEITLGKTGIKTPQNAFGALPIQRVTMDEAVKILQRAYEGGMTFFDTARAYSDSEEKLGQAFEGMRDKIFIASKTMAKTPDEFWKQLDISLTNLKTDYLDIYQLHCVPQCYKPDDGTGMYECMLRGLLSILELLPTILKRLFSVFSQDFMKLCSFLSVIFALKERLNLLICVRKRMLVL